MQVASRFLLAASLALASHAAFAQKVTINGLSQACTELVAMSYDPSSGSLALACSSVASSSCQASGQGTFAILGANGVRPIVAANAAQPIIITRTGGCAGRYYVTYSVAPQTLTGWSLANGELGSNGVSYVTFEAGETVKTLMLKPGTTPGHFGLTLVKAINATTLAQTVLDPSKQFWADVVIR
jgi:hypothetical protein